MDVEKGFDKIQPPFIIKNLQKGDIKGTYINTIKDIHKKPTATIILNCES